MAARSQLSAAKREIAQLRRAVERKLTERAQERSRTTVTGPAVMEIGPGVEVVIERKVWTRVEVPEPRPGHGQGR
jgi:hypothetical protein